MKPIGDIIILKLIEETENNGIILPKELQKEKLTAEVIAVGPDAGDDVRKWDIVYFSKHGMQTIEIDWDKLMFTKPAGILAKK